MQRSAKQLPSISMHSDTVARTFKTLCNFLCVILSFSSRIHTASHFTATDVISIALITTVVVVVVVIIIIIIILFSPHYPSSLLLFILINV
jgi:hypothetical protein